MPGSTQVPAVEGWFTSGEEPALIGARCGACGTYAFPKDITFCRNPGCSSDALEDVRLSRRGTVWSFTINHYPAPPPFVGEPPYAVAAVELAAERMIVLGQVAGDPSALAIGGEVELVVEPLDDERLVWKWRPVP